MYHAVPTSSHGLSVVKLTSRLSGVRRTVTPASTLPTVSETSILSNDPIPIQIPILSYFLEFEDSDRVERKGEGLFWWLVFGMRRWRKSVLSLESYSYSNGDIQVALLT